MARSAIFAPVMVILLTGMVNNVFAFDLTQWKYQAVVTVEDSTDQYCGFVLTPDIYNLARGDLGDIRLVETNGEQIPYVLAKPKDITERQEYRPGVINRSTGAEKAAMVTLDFGKQVIKNSIGVETGGNNFRRAVKVEGSNDNTEFFTLVEHAYVFAVSFDRRFEQIDLPPNDYRYLRVTVLPMATEEQVPVVNEVRAFKVGESLAERQTLEMALIEHSEDEKSNSSIYIYDLAYCRLPVSEIELDIADDSFYRYVTIAGRDAEKLKVKIDSEDNRQRFREVDVGWERIINGTIYRYTSADGQEHENLILRIPSDTRVYRYIRITISNYDDKPVIVNSASANMIAHKIIFEKKDNAAPILYVGSESAMAPQYDLKRKLNNPFQVKAAMAKLSGIASNPLFEQAGQKPAAWTEKHKILLLIVMIIVALVLGGFIFKSFKSIQSEQIQS
ncbi:MAG: hypothetical protein A2168_05335 [Planctomycetes bacterium RBG_13_50_24]|nr:MAG: hypothetical protein A2168_05335 [Planctomycetes bacterium RBG_13_50_24]